jgi:hypothetical protein
MSSCAFVEPLAFRIPRRPRGARAPHARRSPTSRRRRRPSFLVGARPSSVPFVVPLLRPANVEQLWFVTRFVGIVASGDGLESLLIGDPR